MRAFDPARVPKPRVGSSLDGEQLRLLAKLDIEIGCGVGMHSIRYARENPWRVLLAIERTRERYAKFARRVENHPEMPNLVPIHADAVGWITHFVRPASVERYFILYPNPRSRWHALPFMGRLVSTLKPGGTLTLATNLAEYAGEARRFMTAEWGMRLSESASVVEARTHFEKKYLARGERCENLVFERPTAV